MAYSSPPEPHDAGPSLAPGDAATQPVDGGDLLWRPTPWLGVDPTPNFLRVSGPSGPSRIGLRVYSLGPFRVEKDERMILQDGDRARKATTLFKYLLTCLGRPAPTADILLLLWPGVARDAATMDLRSLLYKLRQMLAVPAHGEMGFEQSGGTVTLRLGAGDWWDVAEFISLLAEGARWQEGGDQDRALDAYTTALALYQGEYLEREATAEWARPLRVQLRDDWLRVLTVMAALYRERGADEREEVVLNLILRTDPYRERSYRALMRLLAAQGRKAEALVLYRRLQELLRREFDALPAPQTQQLAADLKAASPLSPSLGARDGADTD